MSVVKDAIGNTAAKSALDESARWMSDEQDWLHLAVLALDQAGLKPLDIEEMLSDHAE